MATFEIDNSDYGYLTTSMAKELTKSNVLDRCQNAQFRLRHACDYIKELEAKIATLEANNG